MFYYIQNAVHALNKLPYSKLDSKSVGIKEGVIFMTYISLIHLQQFVQWRGTHFDGLVVFDECHKAKKLVPQAGSQPTRTCEVVLELQFVVAWLSSIFSLWSFLTN